MARHLDRIAGLWDAIGAATASSRSGSASTPATPRPAASELPTSSTQVRCHHRPHRPRARQRQPRRLRLRRRPARQLRLRAASTRTTSPGSCATPGRRWSARPPGPRGAPRRLRLAARARRVNGASPTRRGLLAAGGVPAAHRVRRGRAGPHCGAEARARARARRPGSPTATIRSSTPTCAGRRAVSRGTVVLVHGGYWQASYGADLMVPLAERWTSLGFATWNLEYRRVGTGGGVPSTLADVAAAVDLLHGQALPGRVVVVGHSAGGQLAVWAASRTARTPGGAPRVRPDGVVSLSGVLDLALAAGSAYAGTPTTSFLGGTPAQVPARYAEADPSRLVPAACPVAVVQAHDDQVVAPEQARSYVAHATAAHGRAPARGARWPLLPDRPHGRVLPGHPRPRGRDVDGVALVAPGRPPGPVAPRRPSPRRLPTGCQRGRFGLGQAHGRDRLDRHRPARRTHHHAGGAPRLPARAGRGAAGRPASCRPLPGRR